MRHMYLTIFPPVQPFNIDELMSSFVIQKERESQQIRNRPRQRLHDQDSSFALFYSTIYLGQKAELGSSTFRHFEVDLHSKHVFETSGGICSLPPNCGPCNNNPINIALGKVHITVRLPLIIFSVSS
jgi:hypothetical protein